VRWGLYKLNPQFTHSSKGAWFQTLGTYRDILLVSSLCFCQMQLVPLHRGHVRAALRAAGRSEDSVSAAEVEFFCKAGLYISRSQLTRSA
jgi:hypothetical protein